MRRAGAAVVVLVAWIALVGTAWAATRQASIGNYWYEDDATGDRTKIVVRQGDQIVFTVREGIYPPHTVDVDELNIHSPGLLLGETYTTPALTKIGNFKLYCRPHEIRGHVTRLIIQAASATTQAPAAATATPTQTGSVPAGTSTPAASASPTPVATLAPVGIGKAPAGALRRPVAVDPDSLEGLTGRARSTEPWTRAVWFLLIASVPVITAAILALRQDFVRAAAKTGTSGSSADRPRSSGRSPRSRTPKASGSGRTSRGRRR